MQTSFAAGLIAATLFASGAVADPWKDESGKRQRRGGYGDPRGHFAREYEEEFLSGGRKVERKWERRGESKEEIKCKGHRW